MASLTLRNVKKSFDRGAPILHGIDFEVSDKEFIALVGPSGCGKSTTLRIIAGLEEASEGEVLIGDRIVNDVPSRDRDIAMVFQSYALYPHMTVRENLSFGLQLRKMPASEVRQRVEQAADILSLGPLLDRRPKALSGGQRQRVAMGRAIVRKPRLFLFDEPLSNLDAELRVQMRAEIKRVHRAVGTTTIYVTHDQVEAMTLADRVVVMNGGRIEQVAPPQQLYHRPDTRFVAGFIGSPGMNFIPGTLVNERGGPTFRLHDGVTLRVPPAFARHALGHARELILGVRPEHIVEQPADESFLLWPEVTPELVEPMGRETMAHFRLGGADVCARLGSNTDISVGGRLRLAVNAEGLQLVDPETDRIL